MKYLDLTQYTYTEESLTAYGFQKQSLGYSCQYSLHQGEYLCEIQVVNDELSVFVYETAEHEEFLPFYIKQNQGAFVSEIRAEVDELIARLLKQCFTESEVKQELLSYAKEYFQTMPEYPWEGISHCVLKSAVKKKWYAIFMRTPYQTLGIERKGSIDIVNVKANPSLITQLIDKQRYFPAYHMNKKYWVTILLDRNTDIEKAKELLRGSYSLVEGK